MLDIADERERVIILLQCSTGIGEGVLPFIKLGDLYKIERKEEGIEIYQIKVYRGYRKDQYITYCSAGCYQAINQYMQFRKRFGEQNMGQKHFCFVSKSTSQIQNRQGSQRLLIFLF
jgi:hypothetical protein